MPVTKKKGVVRGEELHVVGQITAEKKQVNKGTRQKQVIRPMDLRIGKKKNYGWGRRREG